MNSISIVTLRRNLVNSRLITISSRLFFFEFRIKGKSFKCLGGVMEISQENDDILFVVMAEKENLILDIVKILTASSGLMFSTS